MEFVDNTGHIFSLKSYTEKPIGYEYEESQYIFWLDSSTTSKLSINNYYSRPIYALYMLNKDYDTNNLQDDEMSPIQISIEIENSNIYKLIASKSLNSYILSDKYNDLNDYIDLENLSDSNYIKSSLTNNDLFVMKTTEEVVINNMTTQFNYLLIPIYPIGCATEEGVWISNIMIHIYDSNMNLHEWCPISIGGEFVNEYEELIINGHNIGVSLPKDILKAVYSESLYNDEFNESLYNEKLKEYLINKTIIRSECGNFNSAIASLKWFGYGDRISISKLLKTDNTDANQYLLDYFNIKNDIIESFKIFTSSAFISLKLMLNKELDEVYKFNPNKNYKFFGENKPKTLSLLDYYEKIKIGNHDMPIDNDDEKYWYYKPYFDFSFNELGIKLALLKKQYKQYFLPIHLYIHNASLGYRVYANDIKYTVTTGIAMSEPIISLNVKSKEVEFTNDSTYYFSKQIHYVDHNFNEFTVTDVENDPREWYYLNDTCVNIPIKFINNERNFGYFNCILILYNKNISNNPLIETHFSFVQKDKYSYKNFIIYPKKVNLNITGTINDDTINITTKYLEYWINDDYELKLLVNNKWYCHNFRLKIHNPTLDFGTLRYRYYFNEHNYLLSKIQNTDIKEHSFIFTNEIDKIKQIKNISNANNSLYNELNLDGALSFIKPIDLSNIDCLWQHFESNYDILSPFTQLNRIDNMSHTVSFNSYMHNCGLANVNNINFDIDFYNILKYHLDHNLMYIDGTLLNRDFYQYILYEYEGRNVEVLIHKDMIGSQLEIPLSYFNKDKVIVCAWKNNLYILSEISDNSDTYFINNIASNNVLFVSEEDEDGYALLLDTLSLLYDRVNNQYYSIDQITGTILNVYPIYDKLYNNIDYIYGKYSSEINLPNLDKYKNSLHLFDIYISEINETNILVFHNNINIYINGLNFKHEKYNDKEYPDSLKIYISGSPNTSTVDSRYPDIYGLHLIEPYIENNVIINIPEEFRLYNYEYGLYVKRDYEKYYNSGNTKEIYELDNIFEYDTNEFSYYSSKTSEKEMFLGELKFETLDDFYNDKRIDECEQIDDTWYVHGINTTYKVDQYSKPYLIDNKWYVLRSDGLEIDLGINNIFKEGSSYYSYDLNVKDLNDLSKYYKNKLVYNISFYDKDGNRMNDVSLNNIYNIEYSYIKINLFYYEKHIVRNRFYLLVDYIKEYADKGYMFDFIDDNIVRMHKDNESYDIQLIKLSPKYAYNDHLENHLISNQNPAYYWFNLDSDKIISLPSYLNELERYVYNNKEESLDDIIAKLDEYKAKYIDRSYGNDNDDSIEARYSYQNYFSKDFTGKNGTYELRLNSSFIDKYNVRLMLEVFDKDNNKIIYTDKSGQFTLNGDEKSVILYIQLSSLHNIDNVNDWIIPQMIEITNVDKQLEYDFDKYGNDHVSIKILNKEYFYGDNLNEATYCLYDDFFDLNFNIYDAYIENNQLICNLLNSVYTSNKNIDLNMYLDYDFYLMHDDRCWYGLYISKQTCDNAKKIKDLAVPEENKVMSFIGNNTKQTYKLKHNKSSKEYLINRLEFISSNGYNHFNDDDIVACYINNNDRLPFNPYISSKWTISPMSLEMSTDSRFESNTEMAILSIPKNDTRYQKGYYKVTVKYSLDRDIQHQFKNTSTLRIS